MTIHSLPETLAAAVTSVHFGLRANTLSHVSPLSGATQTLERPGAMWRLEATLTTRKRADIEAWLAFFVKLGGSAGRFYAGDPGAATARGNVKNYPSDTPRVKGASQTGKSLNIDTATADASYWLTGDMFALDLPSGGRSLHKLTADVDTLAAAGNATINFAPALRESPADNTDLIHVSPTCVMRLVDDDQAMWRESPLSADDTLYEMAFACIESFNVGE
jgi:hypothetical protein